MAPIRTTEQILRDELVLTNLKLTKALALPVYRQHPILQALQAEASQAIRTNSPCPPNLGLRAQWALVNLLYSQGAQRKPGLNTPANPPS